MLLEFQRDFSAFLQGRATPPRGTERAPGAAHRFDIYRRNYLGNLTGALAGAYPAVQRALGEAAFATLARAHATAYPPREADLHRYGDGFAAALAGAIPEHAWLADLARLDWAAHEALHAPDATVLAPHTLVAAIEGGSRVVLIAHPSLRLVVFDHAVTTLRAALLAHDDEAALAASMAVAHGPEHLAVLRGVVLPLDATTFRLALALTAGVAFANAVSRREDLAALQTLLAGGCFQGLEVS